MQFEQKGQPLRSEQQGQPLRSGYFDRGAFRKKTNSVLVLKTGIAGMQYYVDDNTDEGRELLKSLVPGTELHLFREPDNEHDQWAISVYTSDNRELGYVTRFKNETIARLMDLGKVFHAFVDEPAMPRKDAADAGEDGAAGAAGQAPTPTENFRLPFSIYMED